MRMAPAKTAYTTKVGKLTTKLTLLMDKEKLAVEAHVQHLTSVDSQNTRNEAIQTARGATTPYSFINNMDKATNRRIAACMAQILRIFVAPWIRLLWSKDKEPTHTSESEGSFIVYVVYS